MKFLNNIDGADKLVEDVNNRLVTDVQISAWNLKGSSNLALGTTSATALRGDYGTTAYNHSIVAHAPSDANNYAHPTGEGNNHIPSGGSTGQILKWSAGGTATWVAEASGSTYTHPTNHPPSIITQDASNRFVTDINITNWNQKTDSGHTHSYLPLAGGTLTGQVTGVSAIKSAITGVTSAPFNATFGSAMAVGSFQPMVYGGSTSPSGYVSHISFGAFRPDTQWGSAYIGVGTSDSNPTDYYNFTAYGDIKYNTGRTFWHSDNFNPANYLPLTGGILSGTVAISGSGNDTFVMSGGGGKGVNGAPAGFYPVSAFESYGWNFTVQNTVGGAFKVMLADRTTELMKVSYTGIVYGGSFKGNKNVGGTGEAVHCPSGVYSEGTNWLYGQIITNNNAITAGTGTITCGRIDMTGGLTQDGHTILNGTDTWLRTLGDTGWYSQSWGGGWYMTDATWVRSYNGKGVHTDGMLSCGVGIDIAGFQLTIGANAPSSPTTGDIWIDI